MAAIRSVLETWTHDRPIVIPVAMPAQPAGERDALRQAACVCLGVGARRFAPTRDGARVKSSRIAAIVKVSVVTAARCALLCYARSLCDSGLR
jgi:hypothetical protein